MVELKINGRFSFVQWLQLFGAMAAALITTWSFVMFVTGIAVRESIRKELLQDGMIRTTINESIAHHERVTFEQNTLRYQEIQKQLASIQSSLQVCKAEIQGLKNQ